MTIDRAIEILDKWEFFYGQRAGRELWADKPTEVQNEDIANFCRDLGLVREALERTRWIPCSERLPEPGKRVLTTDGCFVGEMYINKRGQWQRYNVANLEDLMALDILWWMPLPEPPEEKEAKHET